jgi:hypothetical protein
MKRTTFQDWIDFVRGVAPDTQRRAMQELLALAEPEALRLHRLAETLAVTADDWATPSPVPTAVTERAVGMFSVAEPMPVLSLPMLPLRLILDSFLVPQAAGLRTSGQLHRDLVHQAGPLQLSLRVEQEPETELMAVVGQLQHEDNSTASVAGRPVFVFQKEKMVARTLSGDNGEFQMEFSGRQPLRLIVGLDLPACRIEVDLAPNRKQKVKQDPHDGDL